MIRFIIKVETGDQTDGGSRHERFETIDADCPQLESALLRGGSSQYGFETHKLIGVEILKTAPLGQQNQEG